jgi:signal transduction histidine kinase
VGARGDDEGSGTVPQATLSELLAMERRRADSAEQRLRSQTMLFAEAEHKMKTTLAVITGWATTLDESWDKLPDELRRQGVTAIRRNAQDLAEQAGRLLDDARAEITALDLDPVRLDLAEMLEGVTTLFGGVSRAHEVRFERENGETWAWVDPAALQQVLGHLIENAVKYSPDGGCITLRVRPDDDHAVLSVTDEGVGIPAEVDLFAAFQRGEDESTQGAGLGLYIVRNLVQNMGGRVAAHRNEDGPGSTFVITLPGA